MYVLANHVAYAVDKNTGMHLWSTTLARSSTSAGGYGTAVAAGRVIMGDTDVEGLDPVTGAVIWRFAPRLNFPNEHSFDQLATDGVAVYCGGIWGNVYAIDGATGAQRWLTHVTTLPDSIVRVFNPIVANGVVYTAFDDSPRGKLDPESDGGVAAIDAVTGKLLWSIYLPHHFGLPIAETRSVALTPTRVVAGSSDGFLYGLDPNSGAILDTVSQTVFGIQAGQTLGGWFAIDVADTVVVVGANAQMIVGLDSRNLQRKLWTATYTSGTVWDLKAAGGRAYIGFADGYMAALDISTGALAWELAATAFRLGGESSLWAPAVDGSRIYVGADQDAFAFKWH